MFERLTKRLVPEQLRRDIGMIWNGLRGTRIEPFTTRQKTHEAPPTGVTGRRLQLVEVRRETKNAVTLVFADPFGAELPFKAGQFFTLTWPPRSRPGATRFEKRAYSGCSSALDPSRIAVTVKRIEGGAVSNAINDTATVGDVVEVLGPSGSFIVPEAAREIVLLGGGSGITPLMSIARTTLARDPDARITLLFGNRDDEEIIFESALGELTSEHGDRFRVRHTLEKGSARIASAVGRLDEAVLRAELDAIAPSKGAIYFICGPDGMMTSAERVLASRGVAKDKVHVERFVSLRRADVPTFEEHEATIVMDGAPHAVRVAGGETLLEAGLRAGLQMPFSCTVGGCAACRVRLKEGHVTMDEPNCLMPDEIEARYVLACVSRLTGPVVVEVEDG